MKTSENINELSGALAKAQGEITNVKFDSTNPHFKSEFATLQAALNVIRPIFSKHQLAIVQGTAIAEDAILMRTRLVHSSGQWIEIEAPLIMEKNNMQGMGSAMTYARRYQALAIAGIEDEDDDGNKASENNKPKTGSLPTENGPIKPIAKGKGKADVVVTADKKAIDDLVSKYRTIAVTTEEISKYMGVNDVYHLTNDHLFKLSEIGAAIKNKKAKKEDYFR